MYHIPIFFGSIWHALIQPWRPNKMVHMVLNIWAITCTWVDAGIRVQKGMNRTDQNYFHSMQHNNKTHLQSISMYIYIYIYTHIMISYAYAHIRTRTILYYTSQSLYLSLSLSLFPFIHSEVHTIAGWWLLWQNVNGNRPKYDTYWNQAKSLSTPHKPPEKDGHSCLMIPHWGQRVNDLSQKHQPIWVIA